MYHKEIAKNAPTMSEVCDTPIIIAIMSSNLSQLHPTFFSVNEDWFSLGYCLFARLKDQELLLTIIIQEQSVCLINLEPYWHHFMFVLSFWKTPNIIVLQNAGTIVNTFIPKT